MGTMRAVCYTYQADRDHEGRGKYVADGQGLQGHGDVHSRRMGPTSERCNTLTTDRKVTARLV